MVLWQRIKSGRLEALHLHCSRAAYDKFLLLVGRDNPYCLILNVSVLLNIDSAMRWQPHCTCYSSSLWVEKNLSQRKVVLFHKICCDLEELIKSVPDLISDINLPRWSWRSHLLALLVLQSSLDPQTVQIPENPPPLTVPTRQDFLIGRGKHMKNHVEM